MNGQSYILAEGKLSVAKPLYWESTLCNKTTNDRAGIRNELDK